MTFAEKIRAKAAMERAAMFNDGLTPHGVEAKGKKIAASFWGFEWCRHVAEYSDYESRLQPGRTLLRAGGVIDLETGFGTVNAQCVSDELYTQKILIRPPLPETLAEIRGRCAGKITSMADLAAGNLSDEIIRILCDRENGLFPKQDEIRFICNCLDDSLLCPHCAAVLYGTGVRLDDDPAMFFRLRGIRPEAFFDASSVIEEHFALESNDIAQDLDALSEAFGIEFDA